MFHSKVIGHPSLGTIISKMMSIIERQYSLNEFSLLTLNKTYNNIFH